MRKMDSIGWPVAGSSFRYFSLGRHAMVAALRLSDVRPGDKVLIPGFVCRDLLSSLHAVQAVPIFYSVDRFLAPQSLPSEQDIKAVIAINYFGFPQAIEPFRAYCASHGGSLIEDNAHGFLGTDLSGKALGCRGDFGILSFRKTFAMPDGAALLVNRAEWASRLPPPLPCSEHALSATYVARRLLGKIQNRTGLPVRSAAEQMVRSIRRWRTGHAISPSLPESEIVIPGDPAIHCESVRILQTADVLGEVRRRRELFGIFRYRLRVLDIEPVFDDLPEGVSPYGYAFRSTDSTAQAVAAIARKSGFDCGSWPDLPSAVAGCAPEFYRNVRWVNFLC